MTDNGRQVQAGYFGSTDRPLFGWLHRREPCSRIGLVIVPPFGYEAVCAARSLRHLAESAAASGLIALRFDLDGTGDSAGDDLDPARLEQWLGSIDRACEFVRAQGARRIVIAGVRLGASLAALAAGRRDDIDGLVAIATVPSGKALLREAHALQLALGLSPAPAGSELPERELVGFAVSEETWAALSRIDLGACARAPAPRILLIDRDDRPPNDALAAHFAALGAAVSRERLPGYVEMTLDPHRTEVPQAIIDATVSFALALRDEERSSRAVPTANLSSRAHLRFGSAAFDEEAVWIDDHLFAIAARPPSTARRAVILLNSGAVGRIGPNRMYVTLCRRLAARGVLAMRVDLSGIGDSPSRGGDEENVVYHRHAIDDVASALRWARAAGASEIAAAGLCSGGYHALRAALAGQPIDTIVVINPLTFHYVPGAPLDVAAFRITADAARYRKSIASGASWRKLLRGEVKLTRIATVIAHRLGTRAASATKNVLRALRIPLRDDLGTELRLLARRGVAIRFVFANGDPGHSMLGEQGGSVVAQLLASGQISVQTIAGADHTFTPRWTHEQVLRVIEAAVAG